MKHPSLYSHPVIIACALVALGGAPAGATLVQLDISDSFNYDAVGTSAEIAWANTQPGNHRLLDTVGDHDLFSTRAYVNQASVSNPNTGLPDSGALAGFAISQNFQNGNGVDGYTPALNIIRLATRPNSSTLVTDSITLSLDALQQTNYASLDVLFIQNRSNASGNFQTVITANYADASSAVIYDSGLFASSGANQPGGTMGNAGVNTLAGGDGGGFLIGNDGSGFVQNAIVTSTSIRSAGSAGSGSAFSVIDNNVSSSIWHLSNPLTLDESKVLESITFAVSSGVNGRQNDLFIFGVNATAIPEPTTTAMLLGVLSLGVVFAVKRRKPSR